jgi:hypothetical protein
MNVRIFISIAFLLFLVSCSKDVIDFEKISNKVEYGVGIQAPAVRGTFTFEDLVDPEEDSTFVFYEDSIVLQLRQDSAVSFSLADFLGSSNTIEDILDGFPQISESFTNPFPFSFPVFVDTSYVIDTVSFTPEFEVFQDVDIDSIILVDGEITINVSSTFEPDFILHYWSDSGIYVNNQLMRGSIPFSQGNNQTASISLAGAKLNFGENWVDSVLSFDLSYAIELTAQIGQNISDTDAADIDIAIENLTNYEWVYGYFGSFPIKTFGDTDSIDIDIPETPSNISGSFSLGNPRIKFLYQNSFGFSQVFDIGLKAVFPDNSTDSAMFNTISLNKPSTVSNMPNDDSSTVNALALNNILQIPFPEELSLTGAISLNPSGRAIENGYINYVSPESDLQLGLALDIPMEFGANLQFIDTLATDDLFGEDADKLDEYIQYVRLNYTFQNGFPLGFDVDLILYDTISFEKFDTISLSNSSRAFLEPAPVNAEGVVTATLDEIPEISSYFELTSQNIIDISTEANALILKISINTNEEVSAVKILPRYGIRFKIGAEVKANVDTYL